MIFNYWVGGIPPFSTVYIIDPPIDAFGNYSYPGTSYDPSGFLWTYKAANPTDFYSVNISGVQRLPNGNTLICEGVSGRFFEINGSNEIVWQYISPVLNNGVIAVQGGSPAGNLVFRCERFATGYPAFSGKVLTPQGYIETGSVFGCELHEQPPSSVNADDRPGFDFYPNPNSGLLTADLNSLSGGRIVIYNTRGIMVYQEEFTESDKLEIRLPASLTDGIYFVHLVSGNESVKGKLILDRGN